MFEKTKLSSALSAADSLLAKADKLQKAIEAERSRMPEKIREKEKIGRQILADDAREAVGEDISKSELTKLRNRVASLQADIDSSGRKLRGWRDLLTGLGEQLVSTHTDITSELPAHNEKVIDNFAKEWDKAVAEFNRVVSKRAAVEQMTGITLSLTEPRAGALPDLGDDEKPAKTLKDLARLTNRIASMRVTDANLPIIEKDEPYILTHDARGLEKGTLVTAEMFEENRLAELVKIQWARRYHPKDATAGSWAAAKFVTAHRPLPEVQQPDLSNRMPEEKAQMVPDSPERQAEHARGGQWWREEEKYDPKNYPRKMVWKPGENPNSTDL